MMAKMRDRVSDLMQDVFRKVKEEDRAQENGPRVIIGMSESGIDRPHIPAMFMASMTPLSRNQHTGTEVWNKFFPEWCKLVPAAIPAVLLSRSCEKTDAPLWGCMHERAGIGFRAATASKGGYFVRVPHISFAAIHVIPVLLRAISSIAEGSLHCPGGLRWCTREMIGCCSGSVCNLAH
jgi:hypothetical protein